MNKFRLPAVLVSFLGIGALFAWLSRPEVIGFLYDDGIYLMAAKSLATGHGYRLIDIAGQPLLYKYPPLFPVLLSLYLKLGANLLGIQTFNQLLGLAGLSVLFVYLFRLIRLPLFLALSLTLILATNWHFLETVITAMSEPLYFLLTLAALWFASRWESNRTGKNITWLIVFSMLAFYTRTIGLVLIAAIGLWLLLRQARKQAMFYVLSCVALMMPWFIYSAGSPHASWWRHGFLIRTFQESYFQSLATDLHYGYGGNLLALYFDGFQQLWGNFSMYLFPALEPLLLIRAPWAIGILLLGSALLIWPLAVLARESIRKKTFSLPGLYVALYLLILPFWNFTPCYPRFVMVILPFLFWGVILGIRSMGISESAKRWTVGALIVLALGSNLFFLQRYLNQPYENTIAVNQKSDLWGEYRSVMNFIRVRTPSDAVFFSDNGDESYFYGLNTGRPFLDIFAFLPPGQLKLQGTYDEQMRQVAGMFAEKHAAIYDALRHNHVQYVIASKYSITKNDPNDWRLQEKMPIMTFMNKLFPGKFQEVFRSPQSGIGIYRLLP